MSHARYDIWEEPNVNIAFPWRVQMINYVASVSSREAAERLVEATKKYREKEKLK